MQQTVYGYARVSTSSQDFEQQIVEIKEFCKVRDFQLLNIYTDKRTGGNTDRIGYQEMRTLLELNPAACTVVVCTKLDRLGRSLRDLLSFIDFLNQNKIGFIAIRDSIDSTSATGRLHLHVLAVLAEFEKEMINERCEIGRKRFIEGGGKLGKPKKQVSVAEINLLLAEGVPKTRIAKKLKCSIATIYNRLKEIEKK
jgi:DNA invertase Pin-like site-specific DNA recombinase